MRNMVLQIRPDIFYCAGSVIHVVGYHEAKSLLQG